MLVCVCLFFCSPERKDFFFPHAHIKYTNSLFKNQKKNWTHLYIWLYRGFLPLLHSFVSIFPRRILPLLHVKECHDWPHKNLRLSWGGSIFIVGNLKHSQAEARVQCPPYIPSSTFLSSISPTPARLSSPHQWGEGWTQDPDGILFPCKRPLFFWDLLFEEVHSHAKAIFCRDPVQMDLCFICDSSIDDLKNSHTSTCTLSYVLSLWWKLVGHMGVQISCKSPSPQAGPCWSAPLTWAFHQTLTCVFSQLVHICELCLSTPLCSTVLNHGFRLAHKIVAVLMWLPIRSCTGLGDLLLYWRKLELQRKKEFLGWEC